MITGTADRMRHIRPFQVMEVQRRASELERDGRHVIHMEIGQPDFGAPPAVVAAGIAALQNRTLGYTDAFGLPELRAALAAFYLERHALGVQTDRIVITAGASGALLLTLGMLLNPGDEVIMADPGYPCYRNFVRMFDATPVCVPVDDQQSYQLTPEMLKRNWSPKTRGVILASPSNPTGTMIDPAQLAEMADLILSRGGFLIVDEIYQGLTFDRQPATAAALRDDIFVINSFSKYFCMTGWRLGWSIIPSRYRDELEKLAQNIFICPSTPAQYAALAAFDEDSLALLDRRRDEYQKRRDWLVPKLREIGFSVPVVPDGAFYVYAHCGRLGIDSGTLASRVLEEALVALTPGHDFGNHQADHHVRFAYTRPLPELQEGVARLEKFLRR